MDDGLASIRGLLSPGRFFKVQTFIASINRIAFNGSGAREVISSGDCGIAQEWSLAHHYHQGQGCQKT
jgi:hypothetical protein